MASMRDRTAELLRVNLNNGQFDKSFLSFAHFKQYLKANDKPLHAFWAKKAAAEFNAVLAPIKVKPSARKKELERAAQEAQEAKRIDKVELQTELILEDYAKLLDDSFKRYTWKPSGLGGSTKGKGGVSTKGKAQRDLNLFLSDTHFGSDCDPNETSAYGVVEESRRLAKVISETVEFKRQYRANTHLNLLLGGDMICGNLHDTRQGAPLPEQMMRATWLLEKAIKVLAQEFPTMTVHCTSGNHDRDKQRHPKAGVDQKWASWATPVYYAVMRATAACTNVKWNIPKTPYTTFTLVGGHKVFLTHGDTVLNAGYPGKAINVGSIENQINRINSAKRGDEATIFAVGHVHVNSVTRLQGNQKVLITNGTLMPSDSYGASLGYLGENCGQALWESVERHPFGDYRFIEVDKRTDQDISLSKIIPPWPGIVGI